MWFLLIRPQRRRTQGQKSMQDQLRAGRRDHHRRRPPREGSLDRGRRARDRARAGDDRPARPPRRRRGRQRTGNRRGAGIAPGGGSRFRPERWLICCDPGDQSAYPSDSRRPARAGPCRRGPARDSRVAGAQEAAARPRPPGRARGRAQGGSAEGPPADSSDLDRSVDDHAAPRSTSSACPSPTSRKQGNDQIVIELPGVKNAGQAAKIIGTDGAARALRPRERRHRPLDRRAGLPGDRDRRRSTSCSPRARRGRSRARATATAYYLFNTKTRSSWRGRSDRGRPARDEALEEGRRDGGSVPKGFAVLDGARAHDRDHVRGPGRARSARACRPRTRADLLLPVQAQPDAEELTDRSRR